MKKVTVFFGTRPSIIDLAIIIRLLRKSKKVDATFVNTGQHYDHNLDQVFFNELGIPQPHENLGVGSADQAEQTSGVMSAVGTYLRKNDCDLAVVEGDTNSLLGSALGAAKTGVPYAHVEAGLRSFDRTMPEEVNRVLTDQYASLLFAPSELSKKNLLAEGVRESKIHVTGNAIIDVCLENLKKAESSQTLSRLGLQPEEYYVLTAHRAENVDAREPLIKLIKIMNALEKPVIYPLHPRTRKNLESFGLLGSVGKHVKLVEPLGYWDFLKLCNNSSMILSDSGGIQEEASAMKKPIAILRENTERVEILGTFGELTGLDINRVKKAMQVLESRRGKLKKTPSPYGDGKASEKIVKIIEDTDAPLEISSMLDSY